MSRLSCSSRGVFRRRSIGGARRGVPRLRLVTAGLLGRSGAPPARHYDLAARSSLHGLRRIMPQTEARPTAKNRHGGAPRGARPSAEGRKALRSAPGLPREMRVRAPLTRQARRVPLHPCACRRSAHPSRWGFNSTPGRNRAAGTRCVVRMGLFEIVRCDWVVSSADVVTDGTNPCPVILRCSRSCASLEG